MNRSVDQKRNLTVSNSFDMSKSLWCLVLQVEFFTLSVIVT